MLLPAHGFLRNHRMQLIRGIWGDLMGGGVDLRAYRQVAEKWCNLAARRRDHFVELHRSGRWRHYYTEDEFREQMREVIRAAERWAHIANPAAAAE